MQALSKKWNDWWKNIERQEKLLSRGPRTTWIVADLLNQNEIFRWRWLFLNKSDEKIEN